jgi:hypothetical protein
MNFRPLRFLPLLLLATLLPGCAGYQLGDVKPGVYAGIERIHVPPFKNDTLEPRLSSLVTNAVITEIQADGAYKVSERKSADAVLVGTIRRIDKRQLRAVRTDTLRSRELSLFVYVDFHLEDPRTGARIEGVGSRGPNEPKARLGGAEPAVDAEEIGARQGTVVGQTIQFVDPAFQVSERNALSVVAQDVATKLVARLANGW